MDRPTLTRIGSVASSVSETHPRGRDRMVFLNTSDILFGKVINANYSDVEGWPGQAKKSIRRNDILFSEIRPANGRWAFVDFDADDYVVSTKLMVIRANQDRITSRFLYHFLTSKAVTSWLQHLAESRSGTFPQITFDQVAELEIELPTLRVQKAIASLLDAIEARIHLNRLASQIIATTVQALFKEWFLDFGPTRLKTKSQTPNMVSATVGEFFPEMLVDSPIGPVPKGWSVERFDVHMIAERGLSYKGEGLRNDGSGLPMHNLNSVYEGGGYKREGIKYYAGEYKDKHLVRPGDMIVTNTEQGFDHLLIGHAAIVPAHYGERGLFSHHLYRVRPKPVSPLTSHYLVQLFNSDRWHYWISGFSNGTTINMLPSDALQMPLLVVPPADLVAIFTRLAHSAHEQSETSLTESETLVRTRELLFPRLISGEVRVEDAMVLASLCCEQPHRHREALPR